MKILRTHFILLSTDACNEHLAENSQHMTKFSEDPMEAEVDEKKEKKIKINMKYV